MVDEVQQVIQLRVRALAIFIATDGLNHIRRAGCDVFLNAQRVIQLELLGQIADTQCPAA